MLLAGNHLKDGFSLKFAQFLLNSWRGSTQLQYRTRIKRWLSFCLEREINKPFQPPIAFFSDYLLHGFHCAHGICCRSMNTIRLVISAMASHYRSNACKTAPISWQIHEGSFPDTTLFHDFVPRGVQT